MFQPFQQLNMFWNVKYGLHQAETEFCWKSVLPKLILEAKYNLRFLKNSNWYKEFYLVLSNVNLNPNRPLQHLSKYQNEHIEKLHREIGDPVKFLVKLVLMTLTKKLSYKKFLKVWNI